MDLHECPPLVLTVIPLDQVTVERCHTSKAGEPTGPQRPLKGTREHVIEFQVFEPGAERASLFLTPGGERKIGAAGVLTRDSPSGLAVSYEIDIVQNRGTHESPVPAATAQHSVSGGYKYSGKVDVETDNPHIARVFEDMI